MDSHNDIKNHPLYTLVRKMLVEEQQSPQNVINQMVANSVALETAQALVYQIVEENKHLIREASQEQTEEDSDRQNIFFLGIFLAMVLPTISDEMGGYSTLTLVFSIIGAVIGYFYNQKVGVLSAVCGFLLVSLFPFVQSWYFRGRSSYINAEILLIIVITFIPVLILYFSFKSIFYRNK
jgi:DNA-binding FrmR family transcriptional regulator